jgi:hypothetical protein
VILPSTARVPFIHRAPRWFVWLGVPGLVAYAMLIGLNSTSAAGGSDSSGFLNSARLLAAGRFDAPVRMPDALRSQEGVAPSLFEPLGFATLEDRRRVVPTYPTGLPLHLALAGTIAGWAWGPRLIEMGGALAAVWLCYAVGRELGLSRSLATSAAVVLAACPVMLFAAIQPLSDMLATSWCLAAVWTALRARRHPRWAAACGAAFGTAVLVRPTNAVLLPALLLLLGLDWRRLGLAALGGLPCATWLALYNHSLYGGPFRSGYFNWPEFFALRHFIPAATFFLQWLAFFLPAILLVLPVAAFWRRDTRTRELWALALWFAPITGLYLFVEFSHEAWTCVRYLLPALPALILAAMLGVEAMARLFSRDAAAGSRPATLHPPGFPDGTPSGLASRLPAPSSRWAHGSAQRLRRGAAVLIAVWAIGMSWYWSQRLGVFHIKHHENGYMTASAAARAHFPADTLVLSCHLSGAVFYYTDFPVLRWDAFNAHEFNRYAGLAQRAGVTVGAVLFADEEQPALREFCPGDWTRLATIGNVGLWRLAPLPADAAMK